MDCADFAAHGRVVTPWNGMTIPRRYALLCTPKPHTPPRPTAGFRFNGSYFSNKTRSVREATHVDHDGRHPVR